MKKKTEDKYWKSLPTEAVPEKLSVQDLFKELNRLKEHSLKPYSRVSAREKLSVSSCNLHVMACREPGGGDTQQSFVRECSVPEVCFYIPFIENGTPFI